MRLVFCLARCSLEGMASAAPNITTKRKGAIADDTLEIMPIGAGNEVGRSCVLMKFKGKSIMVYCTNSGVDNTMVYISLTAVFTLRILVYRLYLILI